MSKINKNHTSLPEKVVLLLKKGVRMTAPFSVEIGDDVRPERISSALTIYGPARICGKNTLIMRDVKLGGEGPVTLIDCYLGSDVELRGGFFTESVFLNQSSMGGSAHVRSGCLLEEESGGNHCVGLKQTILFPFVQLGSLINFCDCLMAGGTSRKNHSEVGSSYIHFNYTPRQDKATASLIGDVPRGVMLREAPIFLGGQGGIVGPAKIDYGTVIPAGIIFRMGGRKGQKQNSGYPSPDNSPKTIPGVYGNINGKVSLNMAYIANLIALRQWYQNVRREFFINEKHGDLLYLGACDILNKAISERVRQLNQFVRNLEISVSAAAKYSKKGLAEKDLLFQKTFIRNWPHVEEYLCRKAEEKAGDKKRDAFVKIMRKRADEGSSYLEAVRTLKREQAQQGTSWLKSITEDVVSGCMDKINARRQKEK